MPDQTVVQVNPARLRLEPGGQATVGVVVRNQSEDVVYYRLRAEGVPLDWIEAAPDQVSAFPLQDARAELRVRPPASARGGRFAVSVRATASNGNEAAALLDLDVPSAAEPSSGLTGAMPLGLVPQPRASSAIDLTAEPIVDPTLPPNVGKWQVRVRNASSVIDTFGFNVAGARLEALAIEPPQLPLVPGQSDSALLTIRLPDDLPPGLTALVLRAYSHLNLQDQTELPLKLAASGPSGSASAADLSSAEPARGKLAGPVPLELIADRGRITVSPTAPVRINLALQNESGSPLILEVAGSGVPDGWMNVTPPIVSVPPRSAASVVATIAVPAGAPSGVYPVRLRARSRQHATIDVGVDLLADLTAETAGGRGVLPIQLVLETARASVAPGAATELQIQVQNLTTALDTVGVDVAGIDSTWVRVIPPRQTVYPQRQATFRIAIQPPLDPTTALAGRYTIQLKAQSREYAGQEGQTNADLELQLVGDYQASLEQTETRSVRESSYPIRIGNQANAPLQARLSASDPEQLLVYKFDPPELTVPPTGEATSKLTVRAKSATTQERAIAFSVRVAGEFVARGDGRTAGPGFDLAARLIQLPPPRLTLIIDPSRVESADGGRFEVRVGNPTDQPKTVRLLAREASPRNAGPSRLTLDLLATDLLVPPHAEQSTSLIARPSTRAPAHSPRESSIELTATPAGDDALAATATAQLVSSDAARGGFLSRRALLAIPVVALLAGAAAVIASRAPRPLPPVPLPTVAPPPIPKPAPSATPAPPPPATPTTPPTAAAAPTASPTLGVSALQKNVTSILAGLPPRATSVFLNLNGPEKVENDAAAEVTSASTIKLAIMAEVYHQVSQGKLSLDQKITVTSDKVVGGTGVLQNQVGKVLTLRELLETTLTYSDNTGGNMLIDLVGMEQVNQTMASLGFNHLKLERRLMDTQAQQQGKENRASAGDLAEMLRQIDRGQLISKNASADMLRILQLRGQQTDPTLDFLGRKLTPRPTIAHLNGVLTGVRNDAGIVEPPGAAYVLVILLSNQPNEPAAEDAIATASEQIFNSVVHSSG